MTFGLTQPETIEGEPVEANWPLTVRQAAKFLGKRVSRCRVVTSELPFKDLMRRKFDALRLGERPRNIARMIQLRDNRVEDTAAAAAVQLKAAIALEPPEPRPSVTVNVNQQTNVAAISPGYVIRLPAQRAHQPEALPALSRDSN